MLLEAWGKTHRFCAVYQSQSVSILCSTQPCHRTPGSGNFVSFRETFQLQCLRLPLLPPFLPQPPTLTPDRTALPSKVIMGGGVWDGTPFASAPRHLHRSAHARRSAWQPRVQPQTTRTSHAAISILPGAARPQGRRPGGCITTGTSAAMLGPLTQPPKGVSSARFLLAAQGFPSDTTAGHTRASTVSGPLPERRSLASQGSQGEPA